MKNKKWALEAEYFFQKLNYTTDGKELETWFNNQEKKYFIFWLLLSVVGAIGGASYFDINFLSLGMVGASILSICFSLAFTLFIESVDKNNYHLFINLFPTSWFVRKNKLKLLSKWNEVLKDKNMQYLMLNIMDYYIRIEENNYKVGILKKHKEYLTKAFMEEQHLSLDVLLIVFELYKIHNKENFLNGLKNFNSDIPDKVEEKLKEKEINSSFDFNK